MNDVNDQKSRATDDPGCEKRDVSVNKIIITGVIAVIVLIFVVIYLVDLFVATKEKIYYEAVLKPESTALRELRAKETDMLNSYGVIDSAAGIYRIPIERAMKLTAEEAYRDRAGGADR